MALNDANLGETPEFPSFLVKFWDLWLQNDTRIPHKIFILRIGIKNIHICVNETASDGRPFYFSDPFDRVFWYRVLNSVIENALRHFLPPDGSPGLAA